jgi:hypothetical protein
MQTNHYISGVLTKFGVGLVLFAAGYSVEPSYFDQLVSPVIADGEAGQPAIDGPRSVTVAFADQQHSKECEAAKNRALVNAHDLLELASATSELPAECMSGNEKGNVTASNSLPEAIELTGYPSVVSVVTYTVGTPPPVQPPLAPVAERNQSPLDAQVALLDSATLDNIRGGFEVEGSNLKLSFGIERAVFINGALVATTVLNVKDMQRISGGALPAPITLPANAANILSVVQNGIGNTVATQISPNVAGTIIQNTLDNQQIQNITTLNVSVNSLQAMRASHIQSAIQSGIVGALRR